MIIAALDIGEVRIGIAKSDEREAVAFGVESYRRTNKDEVDYRYLAEKLASLNAEKVVIGYPLRLDGTEGPAAIKIKAFMEAFGQYTDIPCVLYDERLTTAQAQRVLIGGQVRRKKRKNVIDLLAAQLILQGYLHGGRKAL